MKKNQYNKLMDKWGKILAPTTEEKREFREWRKNNSKKLPKKK